MKKVLLLVFVSILLANCSKEGKAANFIEGVSEPVINLNETWKVTTNPPEELVASSNLANELLGWTARYSDLQTIFETMVKVYL
jgi:UDP-glucose 4-epimerase